MLEGDKLIGGVNTLSNEERERERERVIKGMKTGGTTPNGDTLFH
jgi:hypothetical protein